MLLEIEDMSPKVKGIFIGASIAFILCNALQDDIKQTCQLKERGKLKN